MKLILSCFVKQLTKGFLYSWGSNKFGQLGLGSNDKCSLIPRILEHEIINREKIRSFSCGETHTALTTQCGSLFIWGR